MDEIRTVEIVQETEDGEPVAAIVRNVSRNCAEFHIVLPVLTHTPSGPVIAPTAFAWDLN
jgi:hypothetical protein